jgi:hypothetical protein
LSIVYASTGASVTAALGLIDMTGVAYDNTTLGTTIGPAATATPNGGIFGTLTAPNTTCLTSEINTSTLTPAGPYSTNSNRPVGIRIYTSTNSRFQLLSISIGFSSV